jgi:hypothetical protein
VGGSTAGRKGRKTDQNRYPSNCCEDEVPSKLKLVVPLPLEAALTSAAQTAG